MGRRARWPGLKIGIDAETRIRDIQAVDRRLMLKPRDSGFDRAVLLISSTRSNRAALHEAGSSLLTNYPVATKAALQALAVGEDPGGNCLIVLYRDSCQVGISTIGAANAAGPSCRMGRLSALWPEVVQIPYGTGILDREIG